MDIPKGTSPLATFGLPQVASQTVPMTKGNRKRRKTCKILGSDFNQHTGFVSTCDFNATLVDFQKYLENIYRRFNFLLKQVSFEIIVDEARGYQRI